MSETVDIGDTVSWDTPAVETPLADLAPILLDANETVTVQTNDLMRLRAVIETLWHSHRWAALLGPPPSFMSYEEQHEWDTTTLGVALKLIDQMRTTGNSSTDD